MRSRTEESGYTVIVRNNNIEDALRRFKQKMKDASLYIDLKKNEQYIKPSRLKKEARDRGKRRAAINAKKNEK